MRNEAGAQERRAVVLHLLTGCAQCVAVTRRLWTLGEAPPDTGAGEAEALYDRMLDGLARRGSRRQRRARSDREAAPRRLAELRQLPAAERRRKIAAGRRFQTPVLCDLLVEESRRCRQPAAAAEWAGLAVEVAGALDGLTLGLTLVRSFQARAWGRLGDARRRGGDLAGAQAALAVAAKALEEGANTLDRAELLELQARLLAEQDRLDGAEALLGRALLLFRTLGERHQEGRVLILAAAVCHRRGGEEAAREIAVRLRQGLERLDEEQEPALAAAAWQRLAGRLAGEGESGEARQAIARARALYGRLEDTAGLVRLRLLEGTLSAAGEGSPEAETAFREAMRDSLLAGLGREAARALIELALLYARQDRGADLERLAEELHPICQVPGVGMSVTMALLFFRRLVETGFATQDVLFEVAHFLGDSPKAQRSGWV